MFKYVYKTHADDPRIPDEEGWRIALWFDGRAEASYPTSLCPDHDSAFSSYEVALSFLLEIYEDNKEGDQS